MGSTWDGYNNFPTTTVSGSYLGTYLLGQTASVTSSVLRIRCRKEAGQTYAYCGAPTPWGGAAQTYGKYSWTVSSLVDRRLILPGSADRRNGYGIDTTSVHR